MGIQFETDYNMETLTAMAKGLRKPCAESAAAAYTFLRQLCWFSVS